MKKTLKNVLAISFVAVFLLTGITVLHYSNVSISKTFHKSEDGLEISEAPVAEVLDVKKTENQVQKTSETAIEVKKTEKTNDSFSKTKDVETKVNLPILDIQNLETYINDNVKDEEEKHTHDFSDWEVTVVPTCASEGEQVRECTECGKIEKVAIESVEHNLVDYVVEATCTSAGTKAKRCTECNYVSDAEVISLPKGHNYAEYISDENATCTKDGTKTAVCTVCGNKNTVTIAGSKLEHTYVTLDNAVASTCETAGKETDMQCTGCGEVIYGAEIKALGHNYSEYVSDENATCTEDGTKTATCAVCGNKKTETVVGSKLAHTYVTLDNAVAPTCETAGKESDKKCTGCGEVIYGAEIKALGHNYSEYVSDENATCTENGTKTATCAVCGNKKTEVVAGSKLAHTYVTLDNAVAPTCETAGKESDKKCTGCGKVIYGAEIKALGHNYSEYVSDKNATCTQDGTKTATCANCGDKLVVADAGSRLEHTYVTLDNAVAPTCKIAGKESDMRCTGCGKMVYGVKIEALGHNYSEYVSDGNATCTKDGTKTATCIACGDKKTVADVDSKIDHTYVTLDNAVSPTCEKAGKESDKKCTGCGKVVYGTEIKALGHNYSEYVSDENATTTKDGTKTAVCTVCGNKNTVADVGSKLAPQINSLEVKDNIVLTEVPKEVKNTEPTGMHNYNITGDSITVYREGSCSFYVDFAKFKCDLNACVGFDGQSEMLQGRRGDSNATVKAPAAKEGYKFKAWVKLDNEEVNGVVVAVYEAQYEKIKENKIATLETKSNNVPVAKSAEPVVEDSCDCKINGHKWNAAGTACECEHCKKDAQDPESGKVWWSCWGSKDEEYKHASIWWVNFSCDTSKCEGFDGGKNYKSEGRRGDIESITMNAPKAKNGFTFIGWYNNGEKITDSNEITVSWENMDKCYEAKYEANN